VVHAPGLFRLDLVVAGDSMRVLIRNHSSGALAYHDDGYAHPVLVHGDTATVAALRPAHHQVAFTLGEAGDAVEVRVVLATLRLPDRDTVRITAQAVVRRGA
jgi:hypothetical protein